MAGLTATLQVITNVDHRRAISIHVIMSFLHGLHRREEPVGARKQRRCRICKKRPPWRDKNCPPNVCKRCYHRHVWPQRPRARQRAQPVVDPWIDDLLGGTSLQDSLFEDEELPVEGFVEDPLIDEPPLEAPPPGEPLLPSRDVEDDHRFDQRAPLATEYDCCDVSALPDPLQP